MECVRDGITFTKQLLVYNDNIREMRRECLNVGLISTVALLAISSFVPIPETAAQLLFSCCAIPLVGAITGVPLFVYIGNALTPILAFVLTAIALSALGISTPK
ncbi:Conserved hypothetical membrane protein [Candidatus Protochlamydia naegleriophila]|uniref:Conserved hypothetical membrane protein n=1 Tax=Candidatus Protochlamydia naegleriophila TaxID=389348 RepID=A0A0U5CRV8_9BACT|nr:hypothetical protein [Candidatus Protochlamydia naegleriophila]CUI17724.1 Conserved hypothetical membrane protein [Candidatus Protochlamydia naegleriophila]